MLLYSSFSFTLSTCIQPPQRKIDGNQSFLLATHLVKSAKSMPNLQFLCPMQILGWRWNKDNNPEKSYEFCLVNSWLFLANFPRTIIQYYLLGILLLSRVVFCQRWRKYRETSFKGSQCQKQTLFLLSLISSVCKTRLVSGATFTVEVNDDWSSTTTFTV